MHANVSCINIRMLILVCAAVICSNTQAVSPLHLTAISPQNNATDVVRVGPSVAVLQFSVNLNTTTVSTNNIILRSAAAKEAITLTAAANQLFIKADHELLPATVYNLSVSGVQGINGELLTAPITITFKTRDAIWGNSQQLESSGQNINASHLAINKQDGSAIAVWSQYLRPSHIGLWASHYGVAQQWDAPQLISSVNDELAGEVFDSAIAIGKDGFAIAVWEEYYNDGVTNGVHFRVWANVYAPAGGWSTPQLIDTESSQGSFSPQIAIAPNGNAMAVWYQYVGGTGRIFASQYIRGSGWSVGTAIDAISGNPGSFNPHIAFDNNNYGYAVWEQWWHGVPLVWANRYAPDRGWIAPQIIQSNRTAFSGDAQFAFDGNGNAIAVWEGSGAVYAARYTRDIGWGNEVAINDGEGYVPGIAINGRGDAFVTWTEVVATGTDSHGITHTRGSVWAARYTLTGGWEAPTLLQYPNGFDAQSASIAVDETGNAIAAWSGYNGTFYRIYTNRYQIGTGWITRKVIDTANTTAAFNPHVVIDNTGNALAIWEQTDAAGIPAIWANQFR